MKKKIWFVLALTLSGFLFMSFSPSLDGRAVVADEGVLPQGIFAKTVGYLPGDSISVTNLVDKTTVDILVIGADTVVAYGDEILGKPKDEEDARRMLTLLQGNTHSVYTGITLVFIDKSGRTGEYCFFEKTDVTMYPMDEDEINRYIATGEPMDKAGSYGIQGRCAIYIKQIEGDYNNVVGLPVARLYQELRRVGYDLKLY